MSKTPKGPQTRVDGEENLSRTCRRAADEMDELKEAEDSAGRAILNRSKSRVPRLSGDLLRSLRVENASTPGVKVASDLVYAPVIHNGWPEHNIQAQPFLSSTLESSVAVVRTLYLGSVKKELNRVKGV